MNTTPGEISIWIKVFLTNYVDQASVDEEISIEVLKCTGVKVLSGDEHRNHADGHHDERNIEDNKIENGVGFIGRTWREVVNG